MSDESQQAQPPEPSRGPAVPEKTPDHPVSGGASAEPPHPKVSGVGEDIPSSEDMRPTLSEKVKTFIVGKPRNLADESLFRHISLIAILAWVGLGADGLSSSCYGPPEAFRNLIEGPLGDHRYLAVFLALAIIGTVFVISSCYSHIIEVFPSGGGGYVVASKLLGRPVGVVSGCALLVDYVMTITVSISAAGDALFGLLGPHWGEYKLGAEAGAIVLLIVLNLRGIKESVQALLPIFIAFLLTHCILIVGAIVLNMGNAADLSKEYYASMQAQLSPTGIGIWGMLGLLLHAYSLGAGTYTGLEAVSNSMPVMREPRVLTGKRTMTYMAFSLAFTAGGLIVAYLLLRISPQGEDKTLNLILTEAFLDELGIRGSFFGMLFLWITLISEGLLLIVGAQAGFIDGPRVLSNMAHDSWMPRWFASLSERLAVHNGVLLMGGAALAALFYTHGDIQVLVIMYSINVFVTFSLSMIGMCRHWWQVRSAGGPWRRRLALFIVGAVLCLSILCVTVYQKLYEGAWRTLVVTSLCTGVAALIHAYYKGVGRRLRVLDETLSAIPTTGEPNMAPTDPTQPTAVILVGGYSGLGIHTMLNVVRFAPDYYKNFIFISAGVVDTGNFKGSDALEELRIHTLDSLGRYVALSRRLGMPAASFMSIGTDVVDDLEQLCLEVARKFPKSTVFAGQLVFQRDSWLHRFLHNQTAYSLQRRLQWAGIPMVILPTRVR
jgi:amino acid transporter